MKILNLFYVYDRINECAITSIIPCNNMLTAAIGFRDSYISNKKSNINFNQLELVNFGYVSVDENGQFYQNSQSFEVKRILGKDIMSFISSELAARGIDDVFEEEEASSVE